MTNDHFQHLAAQRALITRRHQQDGNEQHFIAFFVCSFATAILHPMQARPQRKPQKDEAKPENRNSPPSQASKSTIHSAMLVLAVEETEMARRIW
jgi:hypothetical protein